MFIDITRLHGDRPLRVAVAAIAYMDDGEEGTVLHLVGGQRMLVADTKEDIEARCCPALVAAEAEFVASPLFSEDDADMLAAKISAALTALLDPDKPAPIPIAKKRAGRSEG